MVKLILKTLSPPETGVYLHQMIPKVHSIAGFQGFTDLKIHRLSAVLLKKKIKSLLDTTYSF